MPGVHQRITSLLFALAVWLRPGAAMPADAHASAPAGHGDPFSLVFAVFTILLVSAAMGRYTAIRLKQSPVLGELVIGMAVPFFLGFGAAKILCPGSGVNMPVFVGATLSATSIGVTSGVF